MGLLDLIFRKPKKNIDVTYLNRDLQILNDCAKLIENTVIPEVFFSRYDLYMEKLSILSDAQRAGLVKVTGDNLCKKYKEMNTEEKRVEAIIDFIDRMWIDTCQKADKLKTEKGKQNRYSKFYDTLAQYENHMPEQCIKYYRSRNSETNILKPRNTIPADKIELMQRIEASEHYKNKVYKKYYSDYPEKPYISQDRELNTNWIEDTENWYLMTKQASWIPKSMMERYSDGLLPGHVYMLYWLGKYKNKRIPVYFEYKYGIDFCKEKDFLMQNGYLDDDKPSIKGLNAIKKHKEVIENHAPAKASSTTVKEANDADYEDWIGFINKGGTTEEWNKRKKMK
ncbi:MAG: hypothetical protein E7J94_03075 [Clostridium sp.]|nr:hypothetical protein [Clostridium sp.]